MTAYPGPPAGSRGAREGHWLINKTGAPSVRGEHVEAHTDDFAFKLGDADGNESDAVVVDDGIADGEWCRVAFSGFVQLMLEDGSTATAGYWVRTSITQAGRADATNAAPPGGGIPEHDAHATELGHCHESAGSGTDVLVWCSFHPN